MRTGSASKTELSNYPTKVRSVVDEMLSLEPRLEFLLDTTTYKKFNVIKLVPSFKDYYIQPILFGTKKNLTELSEYLWVKNSKKWATNMTNRHCYGTFKKKHILVPHLYKSIKQYYSYGDKVLDVGCGDGVLIEKVKRKLTNNIYGTELSKDSVDRLKSRFPNMANHFYEDNVVGDKKSDDKGVYDILVASMLLSNVIDEDKALKNLVRKLKKGGYLIVADLNPYYYKALGYYYENELVPIHNPNSPFFTEKKIDGLTVAVHAYRPWGTYKDKLRKYSMRLVNDYVLSVDARSMKNALRKSHIPKKYADEFWKKSRTIRSTPPFYILVMRKY